MVKKFKTSRLKKLFRRKTVKKPVKKAKPALTSKPLAPRQKKIASPKTTPKGALPIEKKPDKILTAEGWKRRLNRRKKSF